jgi:hypothetical protein
MMDDNLIGCNPHKLWGPFDSPQYDIHVEPLREWTYMWSRSNSTKSLPDLISGHKMTI